MRLPIPPEISAWIEDRIRGYRDESPETLLWYAEDVARFHALPLYIDWLEVVALQPDGEIISWAIEGDYEGIRPVEDRYLWLSSLADAVKRYPVLQRLLPERPLNARDCLHLNHPIFAKRGVLCSVCCELGWVLAENSNVDEV